MRVGLITGEYPPLPGGVGDFSAQLAAALAAHGAEVQVLTDARCAAAPPIPGVTVHPLVRRWGWGALPLARAWALRHGVTVANVQYQAAAYALGAPIHFIFDALTVPGVVTFHDLRIPYLFPKAGGLRVAAINHLARTAHAVIVTDPADEAELRRRGIPRPIQHIPIGSNIAPAPPPGYDRAAWRAQHGVAEGEWLLGYFGFLNHSKGGDTLIEALARLVQAGHPAKLALIGGQAGASDPTDAQFGAQVAERIARHGLEPRLIRTGYLDPAGVSAWLLACDVLTLPYRDGVSLRRGSLMAALAHGCAVVSTHAHPLNPHLRDGDTLCLTPPADPAALADMVAALCADPARRQRLGAAARQTARHFEWPAIAQATLNVYS